MATIIKYEDGNISLEKKKKFHTNRGRIAFSNSATDSNHTIYNNYLDIDNEGKWDGMKINCYNGLDIRTGDVNKNEQKTALLIEKNLVSAHKFSGSFQLKNIDEQPSIKNVGTMRYRETSNASYVEICMRDNDTYEWTVIQKQQW